jgi:Flp pilus assembly CpaF family ATPase
VSRKTEVMRLTAEEVSLVEALRSHGVVHAVECLDIAINTVPVESSNFFRSARSALKPNLLLSLTDLVDTGSISTDDVDILLGALADNKNIALTGIEGSGKTTFLKTLLGAMDEAKRVCVLENHEDLEINRSAPSKNIVSMKTNSLSTRDIIGKVLQAPLDRLVLGEVLTGECVASLAVSILCGHSVMFSMYAKDEDDIPNLLEGLCKDGSPHIISTLKQADFIVVRCQKDDAGKRTFSVQK